MVTLPAPPFAERDAQVPDRRSGAARAGVWLAALACGQLPLTLATLAGFEAQLFSFAASLAIAMAIILWAPLQRVFGAGARDRGRLAPLAPSTARLAGAERPAGEPFDRLTGVLSRFGLLASAGGLRPGPGVLVVVDVVGMREINVMAGRAQGDRILAALARRIAANVRPDDVIGRWGGDEFVICLPGLCRVEAGRIIARLRNSLVQHSLTPHDREPMSLAIGMADFTGGGIASIETAIREAEEEIHTDKQRRQSCAA